MQTNEIQTDAGDGVHQDLVAADRVRNEALRKIVKTRQSFVFVDLIRVGFVAWSVIGFNREAKLCESI